MPQTSRNSQRVLPKPAPTYLRYLDTIPTLHELFKTVSEYQMSHLNTVHNDCAHLKQRPGRVHATP
ncbi:Uncharacterized protein OBRU01_00714, partial [Operophtera brumata]